MDLLLQAASMQADYDDDKVIHDQEDGLRTPPVSPLRAVKVKNDMTPPHKDVRKVKSVDVTDVFCVRSRRFYYMKLDTVIRKTHSMTHYKTVDGVHIICKRFTCKRGPIPRNFKCKQCTKCSGSRQTCQLPYYIYYNKDAPTSSWEDNGTQIDAQIAKLYEKFCPSFMSWALK